MNVVRWSCIAMASLLGSCASTPPRFYTLVPELGRDASEAEAAGYRLEVAPVRIPAQVDRLALVSRRSDGGIAIADGDEWIAPVADELQNALSVELRRRLGGAHSDAMKAASVSVRMNVERFESSPNRYALIEASWDLKLKEAGKDFRVVCQTRAYEQVRGGFPEMVKGYQRDVALIAGQIATIAHDTLGGGAAECPVSGAISSLAAADALGSLPGPR
jgi:uncharacterized lipoprotein YmbA